ncbi:MAG: MBL fold metallo-hydrolase [Nitrososphaerota archaeon]|nr:MBL fold metallo-hydrolase [Nitrososphaerota archaeon]
MVGTLPPSRHFSLQKICEGVYAAIASDDGWAICNAGVIDLGDAVVVFDTFVNQSAASDLKGAAAAIAGKPTAFVMNSHFHSDHVKGNQVFEGATIISTTRTREVMSKSRDRYASSVDVVRKEVQSDLDSWRAKPEDPDSVLFRAYDEAHLEGLSTLRYTLPDVTFDSTFVLHGSKRLAEAITYGGGHTVSDAFLYLPEDRVAFMGDLLFVASHPYLADGDIRELLRILDRVKSLDLKVLVPGHGPIGTAGDIDMLIAYIDAVQKLAGETKPTAGGAAQALKPLGGPFEKWKWRAFQKDNFEFVSQKRA